MPQNDVPTLSPAGFVKTPSEKADTLMAHAQASDKSQTKLYPGQVTSLAWLFERYSSDIGALCRQISEAYLTYFGRYFDNVDVDVSVDPTSNLQGNIVNLRMLISFSQDGKAYTVGNLLQGVNGKYANTIKIKESGITS